VKPPFEVALTGCKTHREWRNDMSPEAMWESSCRSPARVFDESLIQRRSATICSVWHMKLILTFLVTE
jgi:hypothetical protein